MKWLKDKKTWYQITAAIALLLIGGVAGAFFTGGFSSFTYTSYRDTSDGYRFIAPLLFVETDEDRAFPEYRPLKDSIQHYTETTDSAESVSVYFRDLTSSQWIGIHQEERYAPASLLKIVTLFAVLQQTRQNESFLDERLRADGLTPGAELQEDYPPKNPIQEGATYTVRTLLEHLITESDNIANVTLIRRVGSAAIAEIYDELAITPPREAKTEGYSAYEYSRLFRTLYNSTYLTRRSSEYALDLLSKSDFTVGIVDGVAASTTVSHKFGVHTTVVNPGLSSEVTKRELHDCGIVYFPNRPYFLCVMTRGKDFSQLEKTLADVSRIVWKEMDQMYGS